MNQKGRCHEHGNGLSNIFGDAIRGVSRAIPEISRFAKLPEDFAKRKNPGIGLHGLRGESVHFASCCEIIELSFRLTRWIP